MSTASLVIGIIGMIISLVPFAGMYALPLTLLAVILGALGMRAIAGRGAAIAGLTCGLLGTALAGWWLYASMAVTDALEKGASQGWEMADSPK